MVQYVYDKVKKLLFKQKQALRTIPVPTSQSESHSKQIMRELCVLNIYQLNILYNVLNLMSKAKNGLIPDAFQNQISHDFTSLLYKKQYVHF